ncbi:MAG: hypothetical protein WC842_03925 [Candidatus Paceibacterota bacterium]
MWVFYALATILLPISVTAGISESYIALGAILGVLINKEKLKSPIIAILFVCPH